MGTGCRTGEILNVQFKQLRSNLNEPHLSNRTRRRKAGSRLLSAEPIHTVQLFLDHANISTSSRYLKPSTRALHTTLQRIDAQRRASGEAARWEQVLAKIADEFAAGATKGLHADTIAVRREA